MKNLIFLVLILTALTGSYNACSQTNPFTIKDSPKSLCVPLYTDSCYSTWGEYGIVGFSLENLTNDSTGCSSNTGYYRWSQYFNLPAAELIAGKTCSGVIRMGSYDDYLSIWIDFNDDLLLSEEEMVVYGLTMEDDLTPFSFSLPAQAAPGQHIMRARVRSYDNPEDPCEEYDYGEAEDYYVNISVLEPPTNLVAERNVGCYTYLGQSVCKSTHGL